MSKAIYRGKVSESRNTIKWSTKEVSRVLLVVLLSGWMLAVASDVWAQEMSSTLAQQIQGSWILVSISVVQDGNKIDPYGPNPRGTLILTPDGRFSAILMRASLSKFASNNRMKGTAKENEAVVQGSHAYFGTYTVASDKERTVNYHIEGSTFPNWDGQDHMRVLTVIGDELKITNPTTSIGGTAYSVWKRAK